MDNFNPFTSVVSVYDIDIIMTIRGIFKNRNNNHEILSVFGINSQETIWRHQ